MRNIFKTLFSIIYKKHYKDTLLLAYPVIIAQVGHMIGGIADSVMLGHVSEDQLAASALANSIYIIPMLFGLGILTSITPLIGKAFGEKNYEYIKRLFPNSIISSLIVGGALALIMSQTSFLLGMINAPKDVVKFAIPFYEVFAFSIIPYSIFLALKQFSEGLQNTKLGMIVTIVCNLLNIFLNYFLIFGNGGFPRMEIMGAAWSTFIARSLMPILMFALLMRDREIRALISLKFKNVIDFKKIKEIFKIGFPIGAQYVFEITSFSLGAIMISWKGSAQLSAHQIALNISALTYLISSGVATGATIRVSNFLGEKNVKSAIEAAYSALAIVMAFMASAGAILLIFNKSIPYLFIENAEIAKTASILFIIMALFQILDGSQVVILGALRGMRDVKMPSLIAMFSYWIIELPIGFYLGISLDLGAPGVWTGYLIGLLLVTILLYNRFVKMKKRLRKQNYEL